MKEKIVSHFRDTKLLFRSIPAVIVALFVVSVISMNLLANKTIYSAKYLAIDGGILVSWLSFMCMDIVTKHFGPKAATKMCVFAAFVNLLVCLIFYIVSIIPTPNMDFSAFNSVLGGTWFILLSSTIAFISSAVINNFTNWWLGRLFKKNPDGKLAFVCRSFVSTFLGQFIDNLIFAIFTFMIFAPIFWGVEYSWTIVQCITCSLIGAGLELFMEIVFSPIGYRISKRWTKDKVGEEYLQISGGAN